MRTKENKKQPECTRQNQSQKQKGRMPSGSPLRRPDIVVVNRSTKTVAMNSEKKHKQEILKTENVPESQIKNQETVGQDSYPYEEKHWKSLTDEL